MTTTVEIDLLATGQQAYAQGAPVSIELWVSNSGPAQNVIVDAVIQDGSTDAVVEGLDLHSLKNLTGISSLPYTWDSTGFDPGQYIVAVEVRDDEGHLLDQAMAPFDLGLYSGAVTAFTATPEQFDAGDTISMTLVFSNTGTVPISGTVSFEVQNGEGEKIQRFTRTFSDLAPGSNREFERGWDTSGTKVDTFGIVGSVLYGGRSAGGLVVVSSEERVYLPLVLRND